MMYVFILLFCREVCRQLKEKRICATVMWKSSFLESTQGKLCIYIFENIFLSNTMTLFHEECSNLECGHIYKRIKVDRTYMYLMLFLSRLRQKVVLLLRV